MLKVQHREKNVYNELQSHTVKQVQKKETERDYI